ncbi:MAG: 3-hydroxy-5-phosphonooxypentane-2,4-dione thiolase [Thermodesulfobacteriota bacterium]
MIRNQGHAFKRRIIDMDWGMKNRLARLVKADGRCFFLPIDHGYFQGPTSKLEKPYQTIKPLIPYADGLFVTRGVLRSAIDPADCPPVILRVSGGSSILAPDLSHETLVTSIKDCLRLNAAAVGMSVFIGGEYEFDSLKNLGELVDAGQEYGLPVMAVTAVGKELEKRTARYLALCCRIAAEFGATIVKTYWCEDFHKVVEGCPAPVVMAGGPKVETEREVFEFVHDGLKRGAIGLNLGRNVWQHQFPVAMMKALRSIVHEKASVKEAETIFEDEKKAALAAAGSRKSKSGARKK